METLMSKHPNVESLNECLRAGAAYKELNVIGFYLASIHDPSIGLPDDRMPKHLITLKFQVDIKGKGCSNLYVSQEAAVSALESYGSVKALDGKHCWVDVANNYVSYIRMALADELKLLISSAPRQEIAPDNPYYEKLLRYQEQDR